MRALVVEDEKKTASFLRQGLIENDIFVDLANDGNTGLSLAGKRLYDIIILDIMLPGLDGWSILENLRKTGKRTPVIFLTAKDTVDDRVKGLELGADDYLVKPFAFSELLARIRAVTRRKQEYRPAEVRLGDLYLNFTSHEVTRNDQCISLTPKEFELLGLLVEHKEEVLSRQVIAREVWDIDFDTGTNVVDVAIRRLRAKVDDPFDKKIIHTLRGVGYVAKIS